MIPLASAAEQMRDTRTQAFSEADALPMIPLATMLTTYGPAGGFVVLAMTMQSPLLDGAFHRFVSQLHARAAAFAGRHCHTTTLVRQR